MKKYAISALAMTAALAMPALAPAQAQDIPDEAIALSMEDAMICASYRLVTAYAFESSDPKRAADATTKHNRWMGYLQSTMKKDRNAVLGEMGSLYRQIEQRWNKMMKDNDPALEEQMVQLGTMCGMMNYDNKAELDRTDPAM